ncbi:DUF3343 domain-containing protein [Abyssisolibacter fermentans]|uniref:DUF3343 domain-containing protein n=1 Tax=Abyssisolibacter fermentans TaxID=1766203 RepID=UPI00083272C5|nr:DUF3343 domain-containing protein [Abyssisolibacter fermentans]
MLRKIMNYRDYYFVIFKTRNQAIQLYYIMERKGYIYFQLISTPCHIRAGCNYAIKFNTLSHYNILLKEAKENNIELDDLYHFHIVKEKRIYDKITNLEY